MINFVVASDFAHWLVRRLPSPVGPSIRPATHAGESNSGEWTTSARQWSEDDSSLSGRMRDASAIRFRPPAGRAPVCQCPAAQQNQVGTPDSDRRHLRGNPRRFREFQCRRLGNANSSEWRGGEFSNDRCTARFVRLPLLSAAHRSLPPPSRTMSCHHIKRQPGPYGLREKRMRRSSAEPRWQTDPN